MPAVVLNSTNPRTRRLRAYTRVATQSCSGCSAPLFWRVRDREVVKLFGGGWFDGSASASWFVASIATSHQMELGGYQMRRSKLPDRRLYGSCGPRAREKECSTMPTVLSAIQPSIAASVCRLT